MIKSNTIYFILILFVFNASLFSQQKNNHFEADWEDWDDEFVDWFDESRPFIELNYGIGEIDHVNYQADFNKVGTIDLKLGYSTVDQYYDDSILWMRDKYLFVSMVGDRLHYDKDLPSNNIGSDISRFGMTRSSGYGYMAGPVSFLLYNTGGFIWTQISDIDESPYPKDNQITSLFYDTFRFGNQGEGGARIQFGSMFALNTSYEFTVVYPRHLFWYWSGSFIFEHIGMSALDAFVDEIVDRSPYAGPIVNFLLKNAYSYGVFLLRKDQMNWPFDTAPPLTFEGFKLGFTFTF